MRVAMCSSEVFPFSKTGGLADVCGALPLALRKLDVNVDIFLPHYRGVHEAGFEVQSLNNFLAVAKLDERVHVYFITHEGHFNRDGLYGDQEGDFADNLERFKFYCIHVLEALKIIPERPDVIHCHDWQTALIPIYLKEHYRQDAFYVSIKTMLTIHNLAFQGLFPKEDYKILELPEKLFTHEIFEFYDQVNLLKAGIMYADIVSTVSPRYAQEIQGEALGCGLHGALKHLPHDVVGILNGLDYDIWNPQKDDLIAAPYQAKNYEIPKARNKVQLQQIVGLPVKKEVPLYGFVGRLSHQKGIDFIVETLDVMLPKDMQVVIQGVGDDESIQQLQDLAKRFPTHIAIQLKFDEALAHQIYAGSDLFLMPSRFEPCGLSQLISLAYGTIPVVFQTGGLADTIVPFEAKSGKGNGFMFDRYEIDNFVTVLKEAGETFHHKDLWRQLIGNAFASRFPWDQSAQAYKNIYQELC